MDSCEGAKPHNHSGVKATRNHFYPKWILFPSDDKPALVKRTTVGQLICDIAIEGKKAVPIPLCHEAVADAMRAIESRRPGYADSFYKLLAHPDQHQDGWVDFLAVAAEKKLVLCFLQEGVQLTAAWQQSLQDIVQEWRSWCLLNRRWLEVAAGPFGFEFFQAVEETESAVAASLHQVPAPGQRLVTAFFDMKS